MSESDPAHTTRIAVLFEGSLAVAALAIGWVAGHSPLVGVDASGRETREQIEAIGWGLIATVPLLAGLLVVDRIPLAPLRRVRDMTAAIVSHMFSGASFLQLAAVAITAGFGEELLFRGLLQAGVSSVLPPGWGPWAALAVGAVAFGVCHWLNTTYALLAVLAGAYFGFLMLATHSIWTPITAHATYDFIALLYLVGSHRVVRSKTEEPKNQRTKEPNDQ
jgi:membrane protease YdiL (CAAX protease family)